MKTSIIAILSLLVVLTVTHLTISDKPNYKRTATTYCVPDVTLNNQDGTPVSLRKHLTADIPIMLTFMYTSCTTLCPTQAVKLSNLQRRLGKEAEQLRLVSITVDPEIDTPQVVDRFLRHYRARPGWDFLTGSQDVIRQVTTAFGVEPSDMVTLDSSLLLRAPHSGQWIRCDGPLGGTDFLREYQLLRR